MTYFRGLTFIEMLVTIAIVVIIMGAIVDSILSFYRANTSALEQEYQVDHARRGIDLMVRDLREATYGADGSYPIGAFASSSISFYADVDNNGTVDRVRYSLSGTTLSRSVTSPSGTPAQYVGGGATTTISQFVRNFNENATLFRYYDEANVEVLPGSSALDIVSVTADMVVDITQQHTPGKFTLRGSATLRNIRAQ